MREAMTRFRAAGWRTSLHSPGLPAELRNREGFAELLRLLDVAFLNQPLAREVLDFVRYLHDRQEQSDWRDLMDAQAASLGPVWNNAEDEVWNHV